MPDSPITCGICGRTFKSASAAIMHSISGHPERKPPKKKRNWFGGKKK